MKLGAFDAIPAHGSITLRDLASCCNAQESLIGTDVPSTLAGKELTQNSEIDETVDLRQHLHRSESWGMGS